MTYDDLKARLGIRPSPKSHNWSFSPDWMGAVKPEPDYWDGPMSVAKPPIQEDLSHLAADKRVVDAAKAYWANLTPAERRKQVLMRKRIAKMAAEKRRKKLGNRIKDGPVPGMRVPSDRKHARKRAGSLS